MTEVRIDKSAPRIAWGDKFEGWDMARKIDYLKKFGESMNHAAKVMQDERDAALQTISVLKKQTEAAEQALMIQKNISTANILQANERSQTDAKRIQELEAKVRELKAAG